MLQERYRFVELPELPPSMSRRGGWAGVLLGKAILKALGWKVKGAFPDTPKFVLVAAPHTSNWDAVVGLAAALRLRLDVQFYAKHQAFRPPLGWLLRRLGGIPVNRNTPRGLVSKAVQDFQEREAFVLGIAPEGTRKRTDRWKTGFHAIARAAQVPVVLVALDFGRKTIGPIATISLTDDREHDLRVLADIFGRVAGKNLDNYTPPSPTQWGEGKG